MPVHRPGSGNAAASVCLYRKQERPKIVRPCQTAYALTYPGAGRRPCTPVLFPACVSPQRHPPFHAPICPRRRPIILRRPTGWGDWRFPGRPSGGQSAIAFPRSCSPIPSPGRFVKFRARHRQLCRSSAGGAGATASGTGRRSPPPFTPLPAIQLTTPVKDVLGPNRESRSRTGN